MSKKDEKDRSFNIRQLVYQTLIMSLFCTIGLSQGFGQNVLDQEITLSARTQTMKTILNDISKSSNVQFTFLSDILPDSENVYFVAKKLKLKEVLNRLLTPYDLQYEVMGSQIILKKLDKQEGDNYHYVKTTVGGIVKSSDGAPLPNASVKIKGSSIGTQTSEAGRFQIESPNESGVLEISYVGFKPAEVAFNSGNTNIEVILLPNEVSKQDEVIVVGYGTQTKLKVSDAISTVKMDNVMRDRPVSNAGAALEGAIPGLNISIGSGQPGTKPNFNIRGWSSINGGNPLFVVNNIPMDDISLLNPADFDNVSVLKDASASVLYGARAAFGVVLITTKKGRVNQPTSFEYAAGYSPTYVSTLPQKLNPREWVDVMKRIGQDKWWSGPFIGVFDSLLNAYAANPSQFPSDGIVQVGAAKYSLLGHNQFGQYFNGGNEQYHNFTASGGSDKIFFRSSVRFVNENGVIVGNSDKFKRWSTDNSITALITSKLNFSANILYNNYSSTEPGGGYDYPFYAMVTQPSFTPIGYDSVLSQGVMKYLPYGTQNNMAVLQNPKLKSGDQLRLSTKLNFTPVRNLTLTGEYTYEKTFDNESRANNNPLIETIQPEYILNQPLDPNAQSFTDYYKNNYLKQHQIMNVYGKYVFNQFGDHHLDILLGTNQEYVAYEMNGVSRKGLLSLSVPSISTATGALNGYDGFYRYAISGYFGQLHYDYKSKYLLQVGARYDGSSRFPSGARFGFFPSASAAWNMMSEDFMSSLKPAITVLKPRVSFGAIGNQVTGDNYYPAIPTMSAGNASWLNTSNSTPFTQVNTPGLVSSSLTWERVTTLGFGLDVTALKNRLNVSFDYFVRKTTGMITKARPLPSILGTEAPRTNAADLKTKGFELNVGWNDNIGKVRYSISANLSDDRGIITKYDNPSGSLSDYYEGQNLGEIWGYESKGLFQVDQFENLNTSLTGGELTEASKKSGWAGFEGVNQNPGDMAFVDRNGDGKINGGDWTLSNPGDRKVIGNSSHRYRYGINGSVSYKGFDFSFFINGIGKREFWADNAFTQPWKDQYFDILPQNTDFWTSNNTGAHFYRIYPNGGGNQWTSRNTQTRYLLNGAYLRVKNLALGYTFPEAVSRTIAMKKIRVFISAENMFTFDHLPDGMDPGTNDLNGWSGGTYPYIKKFNFGINVNF
jgi:TonB-linked SusC/RagA family outer membrane protein